MWQDGLFEATQLLLENGDILAPVKIAYSIMGNPRTAPGGLVVLLPSASGLKSWGYAQVGAAAIFESTQYAVVTIDAIGGGGSSRPSGGLGKEFAPYTIRDQARAVYLLLNQGLQVTEVTAVGGPSMGAMIALELGLLYPHFARKLLLYSPSIKCSAVFKVLIEAITRIAPLTPDGMYAAALAYFPLLVSGTYLEQFSAHELKDVAHVVAESWSKNWNCDDLVSRYRSLMSYDIRRSGHGFEATLRELTSAALLMPSSSDVLLPLAATESMAAWIPHSTLVPIVSDKGHWAASQPPGSDEYAQIRRATRRFLGE